MLHPIFNAFLASYRRRHSAINVHIWSPRASYSCKIKGSTWCLKKKCPSQKVLHKGWCNIWKSECPPWNQTLALSFKMQIPIFFIASRQDFCELDRTSQQGTIPRIPKRDWINPWNSLDRCAVSARPGFTLGVSSVRIRTTNGTRWYSATIVSKQAQLVLPPLSVSRHSSFCHHCQ